MDHHLLVAALLIDLSATIAIVDGLYLHLYKYKLYARRDSVTEHLTHTLRAVLFGPMIYLLFGRCFAGAVLYATLAIVLVDFAIQSWDVLVERASRSSLGGLSSFEYWIHVAAITTHVAAVTLVLAARPAEAWSLSAPTVLAVEWPAIARWSALGLLPGAVGLAVLHLWLLRPRYRVAAT
ncbi:MAG: hypothetical protein ACM31C_15750 [Acidobacteriota bacterium]